MARREGKRSLHSPDWSDLVQHFPNGLYDRDSTVRAIRLIVRELQHAITLRGYMIFLEVPDTCDGTPESLLVTNSVRSLSLRLAFRAESVAVAGKPVFVAHDDGTLALANEITRQVRNALR